MSAYSFPTLTTDIIATLKQLNKSDCEQATRILNERLESIQFYKDYESIELFDLPLSVRAFNGLAAERLRTVGDVLHYGLDNIWKLRYIGPKSETEIKELFKKILLRKSELIGLSKEEIKKLLTHA